MFWERHKVDAAVNDGASTSTAAVTEPIDIANEEDRYIFRFKELSAL